MQPLDTVTLHHRGELFLPGCHPLAPLGFLPGGAFEALRGEGLLEGRSCVQPVLAAGGERHEVDVQVRCRLHNHPALRYAPQEILLFGESR